MSHRYTEGGSFVINRQFKGIGRIHLASGIRQTTAWRAFDAALTEMATDPIGREWLRAMKTRRIKPLDLWAKYKTGKWREAPRPETSKQLVKALEDWRDNTRGSVSDDTYRNRGTLVRQVRAIALKATVDELPFVIRTIRAEKLAKGHAVTFNHLRNWARAFARDTLGRRNDVYQALALDVEPMEVKHTMRAKHHPLAPSEVLALAAKFPTNNPGGSREKASGRAPGHGHVVIGMALTGMHPKEFFGEWQNRATHVHIDGTKRKARVRDVPKLFPSKLWPSEMLKTASINAKSFGRAFRTARDAANITCTPLDLRRSFANWMEAAGIPRTRRKVYMGHSAGDITALYEAHEVTAYLSEDGAKLRAWIDDQIAKAEERAKAAST